VSVRNLDALLAPQSVAVIGASSRADSLGAMVWQRVLTGAFSGPVWPVNPKYDQLDGRPVYSLNRLPGVPSVAVICTAPDTWPDIVGKLGALGARVAVIVGAARSRSDRAALARALSAARPYLLRIVGPASLGVAGGASGAHLGAFASPVARGGVAWVSQSNALTNAVMGWAQARGLGFSHVVALGDEADVDAADVLDCLASDAATHAILLELDSVKSARKFMSAARAAARNKPVFALRTGRSDPGDRLYSAAFQRAGIVRVYALDELLDEIETLGLGRPTVTGSATLVTSDAGLARLSLDALDAAGATLAAWPPTVRDAVERALPHLDVDNPLLLGDDARPEAFGTALEALSAHAQTGTAFVVHAASHSAPTEAVAQVLIAARRRAPRGLLACFFGSISAATRDALHVQGIPVYPTPHRLARAYARLVDYQLGRELLMQTPEGSSPQPAEAVAAAQHEAKALIHAPNPQLLAAEAARWLAHFGIEAAGAGDAEPIVDIEVEMYDDTNFGPVFRYAAPPADGVSARFVVYALPPFNTVLARAVMARSPYARRAALEPLLAVLTALSQAVCEVRELVSMKLVLRVLPERVVVDDAHLRFAQGRSRLAIMPYPRHLEEVLDWHGGRITLRPIRPEDEASHHAFVSAMTPEDLRMRFFGAIRQFEHTQMARLTQIDYDREMALIATEPDADGEERTLGVVRAVNDPDNETTEFAIAVRPDQKGRGLGRLLMARIVAYARSRGTKRMVGETLRENRAMIGLAKASGFSVENTEDPGVVGLFLSLQA
jgi:acetyltransferase